MFCKYCGKENDQDAEFCKYCGQNLILKEEQNKKNNEYKKSKTKKQRVPKGSSKTKKVKIKDKRNKNAGRSKNSKVDKRMSFAQMLFVLFLVIIIFGLLGIIGYLGYHAWLNKAVEVPYVIGNTYNEARIKIEDRGLEISKKTKVVEDEKQVGKVIKQNKKDGKKVSKGSTITVTVGVKDKTVVLEDYTGLNIDSAKNKLDQLNISYKVEYKTSDEYSEGVVIEQSLEAGSEIKPGKEITLTVAKAKEDNSDNSERSESDNNTNNEKDNTTVEDNTSSLRE